MSAGPARAHTHSHPLPGPADPRLGPGPQGVQEDTPGLEGAVTPEMQEGPPHSGDPLQAPGLSEASAAPLPSCQELHSQAASLSNPPITNACHQEHTVLIRRSQPDRWVVCGERGSEEGGEATFKVTLRLSK